jgi:hypothetical protein
MKPRVSILALTLFVPAIDAVLVARRSLQTPEPEFGGRSLWSWLPDLHFPAEPKTRSNATYAIQQTGTSTVPLSANAITNKVAVGRFHSPGRKGCLFFWHLSA